MHPNFLGSKLDACFDSLSLLVVCLILCLVILDSKLYLVTLGFPTEYLYVLLLGAEGKHQPENILHPFWRVLA